MKATETRFERFLQGVKQFVIPIYQRTYSWSEDQCEQLWDDIVRVSENEDIPGHFIGSIVYIERGLYQVSAVPQLLVIDGQQRLTTLSLLLIALAKELESSESKKITSNKILNSYLLNNDEIEDKKYKLILTQSDKETIFDLLENRDVSDSHSKNIVDNFNFFRNKIQKSKIPVDSLYQGICKLIIVDISLDSNYDNPQLIFESLNSTGLELSQADLIRNYVLMGLESKTQEEIYNNVWYPMEKKFGHSEGIDFFDRFMRDYLTIKTDEIPKEKEVYQSFKEYFSSQGKEIHELVNDIYYYSKFFTTLVFENADDSEINKIIHDINSLSVDVVYPFLLQIYRDYNQNIVTREEFLEILKLLESYVFRRQICVIPTNSLNKTFATLYGYVDKKNYLESLKAAFALKDSYKRFPTDIEFSEQFQIKNVYNFRTRSYLFRKLENYERKEPVVIDEYTLEHIMPQNEKLSSEWQTELGEKWQEVHETHLHRVGNLTLTGYNSELSDRPFQKKQTMGGGFKDSPIRLNSSITSLEHWNKETIEKRSKELSGKALMIWSFPHVPQEVLEQYKSEAEEDEDEDEDEDTHSEKWDEKLSRSNDDIQQIIATAKTTIEEKFDCISKPWNSWYGFHVQSPTKRKNSFLVFRCSKTTADACFRINPETFDYNDPEIRKIKGFFFKNKEYRIFMTKTNLEKILTYAEHAYNTTLESMKNEKQKQSEAAKKAWITRNKLKNLDSFKGS